MKRKIEVERVKLTIKEYEVDSYKDLKELYESWQQQRILMKKHDGRMPNIPEAMTEGLIAYVTDGGVRKIKAITPKGIKASYDCYNLNKKNRIQVKASSSAGPTSFGPKTEWDELYLVDFYNNGNVDGNFKIYDATKVDIDSIMVNTDETIGDQKKAGRRPRVSMFNIIEQENLKPVLKGNITNIADMKKKFGVL